MEDVLMPKLSDAMETGTIVRWLTRQGDHVEEGQDLVEIDTDKATMVYESPYEGTLEIVAAEGDDVAIGALIARIGALPDERAQADAGEAPTQEPMAASGEDAPGQSSDRPEADTPDVQTGVRGTVVRHELTNEQRVVVRRMSTSKATAPEFTIETEVVMEACAAARAEMKAGGGDAVPSFNDFVVRACATALREHPHVNAAFVDDGIELYERVNVGMAVTAPGRLLVPTIFDADRKDLVTIAQETRALAARVREGAMSPAELDGGTFTVSNLGMLGIRRFNAVLNPPQAAILAVGQVAPQPLVRDGVVLASPVMSLTLTCDHRVIYGAEAAAFLSTIRDRLEAP